MATDAYARMIQLMQRQRADSPFFIGSVTDPEHIVVGGNILDVGDDIFLLDSVGELQTEDEVLAVEIEIEDDDDENFYICIGRIEGRQ